MSQQQQQQQTWVLPSFVCAITGAMRDPVTLVAMPDACKRSYERAAIEQWLSTHNTDPLTSEPLEGLGVGRGSGGLGTMLTTSLP